MKNKILLKISILICLLAMIGILYFTFTKHSKNPNDLEHIDLQGQLFSKPDCSTYTDEDSVYMCELDKDIVEAKKKSNQEGVSFNLETYLKNNSYRSRNSSEILKRGALEYLKLGKCDEALTLAKTAKSIDEVFGVNSDESKEIIQIISSLIQENKCFVNI